MGLKAVSSATLLKPIRVKVIIVNYDEARKTSMLSPVVVF